MVLPPVEHNRLNTGHIWWYIVHMIKWNSSVTGKSIRHDNIGFDSKGVFKMKEIKWCELNWTRSEHKMNWTEMKSTDQWISFLFRHYEVTKIWQRKLLKISGSDNPTVTWGLLTVESHKYRHESYTAWKKNLWATIFAADRLVHVHLLSNFCDLHELRKAHNY